ncbi:MAG: hypothetical protein AAB074_15795 [Planctomycetota bacterium]
MRTLLSPCLAALATAACFAMNASAEEPASADVFIETADGTMIAGTLPSDLAFVLARPDGETKIAAGAVRRLAVSSLREAEALELEASVKGIGVRWKSEEFEEREAATKEALKLPAAAAAFLSRLRADPDAEVGARAREVLEEIQARGDPGDARDQVFADGKILRGWLKLETFTLTTMLGPAKISLADVRTLRRVEEPERLPRATQEDEWPPPPPDRPAPPPANGSIQVAMLLRNGWRLVGELAPEALSLEGENGDLVAMENLVRLERAKDDRKFFRVIRKGKPSVSATLAADEVALDALVGRWAVPADDIEWIEFGPLRRNSGALVQLIADFTAAKAAGEKRLESKFWVHIRDQRANPWDSAGKVGMTWSLLDVQGDACLVGVHAKSNAYQGDTSVEEELPILAIRKGKFAPPEGLDVSNAYRGWASGEIRLTRPVRGTAMTSLEAANKLVVEEFGDGWRMAQFHDTNRTGWHWWAYWVDPTGKEK